MLAARARTFPVLLAFWLGAAVACGQIFERPNLLPPAEIDLLDSSAATHLENARRFLAEKQWEEGVDAIRRVMEADAGRFVKVPMGEMAPDGFERFIPAREYCQWRMAALAHEAPEALAHYRRLIDPLASKWLEQAAAERDESSLRRIVDQAFASRSGDEALLRLGDAALARGEHGLARTYYARLARRPAETPQPAELSEVYPVSDIPPADIAARLVLVSILEGSAERAAQELAQLKEQHPQASGKLAGKTGNYGDTLAAILTQSASWPATKRSADWPTFGGTPARDGKATAEIDIAGQPLWSFALPRLQSDREWIGAGRLRPGDDMKQLRSYFPVVVENHVLLRVDARRRSYVTALSADSGAAVWQVEESRAPPLKDEKEEQAEEGPWEVSDAHATLARHVGVARYTLSVHGHKLFARIGSPVSAPSDRRLDRLVVKDQGWLMGLDLRTQGKPLDGFPIQPESNYWSFEGTPLADDAHVYVAMRRIEQGRCQLYLACFDLVTTPQAVPADADENFRSTGRLRWRTKLCAGATLGGGDMDEVSHVLLSQDAGMLYCNTNLGAVCAVSAADGRLRWVVKYPRAPFRAADEGRNESHFFRDLNPCLITQDAVIVAPSDCQRIFCLDRGTGRLRWASGEGLAADAMHLLGAGPESLIAGGDYLYWIDRHTGALQTQFPAPQPSGPMFAAPSPRGMGRGVLAGEHVWFPTQEKILVFHQTPRRTQSGYLPQGIREIPLVPRGATGGNLIIAGGKLFIATGDRLFAFGESGPAKKVETFEDKSQ